MYSCTLDRLNRRNHLDCLDRLDQLFGYFGYFGNFGTLVLLYYCLDILLSGGERMRSVSDIWLYLVLSYFRQTYLSRDKTSTVLRSYWI